MKYFITDCSFCCLLFLFAFYSFLTGCTQGEQSSTIQKGEDKVDSRILSPSIKSEIPDTETPNTSRLRHYRQAEAWIENIGFEEGLSAQLGKKVVFMSIELGESELECVIEGIAMMAMATSGGDCKSEINHQKGTKSSYMKTEAAILKGFKVFAFTSEEDGNNVFDIRIEKDDHTVASYNEIIDKTLRQVLKNIKPDPFSEEGKAFLTELKEEGVITKCFWNDQRDHVSCVVIATQMSETEARQREGTGQSENATIPQGN